MGAFPLGGRCLLPRPQTDEGRPCHCHPVTGCQGTLSPHQSASRTASPPGEKPFPQNINENARRVSTAGIVHAINY
jgi:hypothetical protein